MKVTSAPPLGATGHGSTVLYFVKTSASPCVLSGYPGVAGLNASGQQVVQAQRTLQGFMGGLQQYKGGPLPRVELFGNTETPSAVVESTDIPTGSAAIVSQLCRVARDPTQHNEVCPAQCRVARLQRPPSPSGRARQQRHGSCSTVMT